jgi:hypothetical protein
MKEKNRTTINDEEPTGLIIYKPTHPVKPALNLFSE